MSGVRIIVRWGLIFEIIMNIYDLHNFSSDGNEILKLAFKHLQKVAIKVPDFFDFSELKKFGKDYEIQDNMINGEVGFRTVYFDLK